LSTAASQRLQTGRLVVAIVPVAHLGSDVATTEAFDLDVSVPAFSNILPTD
jgi:hypothetical protein